MTAKFVCDIHGLPCTELHPKSWPTPLIPDDVLAEVMGAAVHDSVVMQFARRRGPIKPRPWYWRVWHRIDRYLPRVSVHLGPR